MMFSSVAVGKPAEAAQRMQERFHAAFGQWFSKATMPAPISVEGDCDRDCLTQDRVSDIFIVLQRDNGTTIKVDADSLIDYILASGDYTDPETRQPFSEETLLMLDVFGKRLNKPSVLESRETRAEQFKAEKDTRDTLASLENIIGNCVSEMYNALEAVNESKETPEDASLRMLTDVVPILEDAFKQLVSIDPEDARICASQMEAFLVGPKRKPTPDRKGFLKTILNIFHAACGQE